MLCLGDGHRWKLFSSKTRFLHLGFIIFSFLNQAVITKVSTPSKKSYYQKRWPLTYFLVLSLSFGFALAGCTQDSLGVEKAPTPESMTTTIKPMPTQINLPSTELIKILIATPDSQPKPDFSYIGKLDSHIQSLLIDYFTDKDINQAASTEGISISAGNILVDIYISGDFETADGLLRQIGMDITAEGNAQHLVIAGWLPLDSILPAAQFGNVKAILPITGFVTNK